MSFLSKQVKDIGPLHKQEGQIFEHERQLKYWIKQLEGSQPAELLCDKPRAAIFSGQADTHPIAIEGVLYQELQNFCRIHQTTPFIVLLAAFRVAHYRLTGVEDTIIRTPNANRNREELEGLIGFFVNLQCIRIKVQGGSFQELVNQVQAMAIEAFAHQDVPFERIVAELHLEQRDPSRTPVVQIAFAVNSLEDANEFALEGMKAEQIHAIPTTRFDLEFHLFQGDGCLRGSVIYATDLFEA